MLDWPYSQCLHGHMRVLVVHSSHYRPETFFRPGATKNSNPALFSKVMILMPAGSFFSFCRTLTRQKTHPERDCPILSHMSRMRPQSSAVFISLVAFSGEKKSITTTTICKSTFLGQVHIDERKTKKKTFNIIKGSKCQAKKDESEVRDHHHFIAHTKQLNHKAIRAKYYSAKPWLNHITWIVCCRNNSTSNLLFSRRKEVFSLKVLGGLLFSRINHTCMPTQYLNDVTSPHISWSDPSLK